MFLLTKSAIPGTMREHQDIAEKESKNKVCMLKLVVAATKALCAPEWKLEQVDAFSQADNEIL